MVIRLRFCSVVSVSALALVSVLVAGLFVFPRSASGPPAADAVVLLAGSPGVRLPVAQGLAQRDTGVLVVSAAGGEGNAPARALCDAPGALTVHCFVPDPSNTRGEARAIGQLVEERGWDRITVVTSTYHMTRAGLLIRRCTDAEVAMVEARPPYSLGEWVTQIGEESAGLVAAVLRPAC